MEETYIHVKNIKKLIKNNKLNQDNQGSVITP